MKKVLKKIQLFGLLFALVFATAGCSKDDVAAATTTPIVKDDADAFVGTWEGTLSVSGNISFTFVKKNAQVVTNTQQISNNNNVSVFNTDCVVRGKVLTYPLSSGQTYTSITFTVVTSNSIELVAPYSGTNGSGTNRGILYKK
jgi:hypothetical protein